MQRGVSIAVLTIVLAGMLTPLVQGSLMLAPACCRVGGEHHCMGKAGLDGFRSSASQCPYRTYPAITKTSPAAAVARTSLVQQQRVIADLCLESAAAQKDLPSSDLRKRGPPSA